MKKRSYSMIPLLRLFLAVAGLFLGVEGLLAQELVMKDGRKIPAPGASRRGDKLFVTVNMAGGVGQIAYDLNQIANVKLPDSPEFLNAQRLLADDKAAEALAQIDKVIRPVEAFRGLGNDRWGNAQLIKSAALSTLGRQAEAEDVLKAVNTMDVRTPAARIAETRLASFAPWDPKKADAWVRLADSGVDPANPPALRAAAYVLRARVLHDQEKYEEALRAALYATIFFSAERFEISRAQLIAADCYFELGDKNRGVRAYHEIVTSFPNTANATVAQKEISKGGEAFAVIVKALEAQEKENQSKLEADQPKTASPKPTSTPNP